MSELEHVSTRRLFDFAAGELTLNSEEKRHVQSCVECAEVIVNCRRWIQYSAQLENNDKAS